jgi:hypothetical protein
MTILAFCPSAVLQLSSATTLRVTVNVLRLCEVLKKLKQSVPYYCTLPVGM